MNIRDTVSFFLQAASVGIVAAFLLLQFRPEWFEADEQPVVELRQAPDHEPLPVGAHPAAGPVSYADVIEPAAQAVVNVYTAKLITRERHPLLDDPIFRYFFGDRLEISPRQQLQTSLGSGVILSAQGYVLTNSHVIEGADEIQVLLQDGRTTEAEVVGIDSGTDLAVLRIRLDNLPTIKIGSTKNLRVGDVVLAIGNPYGVGQTVTLGIVSATGRNQLGISRYEDFIQTDAAINPGNSGGALINAWGELIGINTAIFSKSGGSQGIGFAIPAHQVTNVLKQIIEHGYVQRGWLGIEAQDLTAALAETFNVKGTRGMLIAGVLRGSPADKAGIKPGDVVQEINGEPVHNARSAVSLIARMGPGTDIRIAGTREGKPFQLQARTGSQPENQTTR
jgi:serine protease DegS